MGYERQSFTVHVRLSRHNDERDREHDEAFESLQAEVRALCSTPEYKQIEAEVGP